MVLPDHKKIIYLPHTEYRSITALYSLACDGIHYCLYKEYFDSIENKFNNTPHLYNWYILTVNAYYDLAISNWCKLFGSYSEPTHYYHLLGIHALKTKLIEININPPNKEQLKSNLLILSKLSINDFDQYHQLTKDYRDKNLIHREHSPTKIKDGDLSYPKIDTAKENFLSLTLILIKLAKRFPNTQDKINCYQFIYDDFDSKDKILELIQKSIPNFIGNKK